MVNTLSIKTLLTLLFTAAGINSLGVANPVPPQQ